MSEAGETSPKEPPVPEAENILPEPEELETATPAADATQAAPAEAAPAVTSDAAPAEVAPAAEGKAIQEFNYSEPTIWDTAIEIFSLPGDVSEKVTATLEKAPVINLGDNPDSRRWAQVVMFSLENTTYKDMFMDALKDKNAEFHQMVEYQGVSLGISAPKQKHLENQNIKGEGAVLRTMTSLGIGTMTQVPLWHSGIWVTFKPPSDSELVELNRLIMSDKIAFGRYSYGLIYSNITGYTVDRLVEFAMQHIYDTTVKTSEIAIDQLMDYISSLDIPSLLWGFMCTVYPRGFQYERACTTDPAKCQNIIQERLNLMKLQWTNTAGLTDWQKAHMSGRQSRQKDKASIMRYQEELRIRAPRKVSIESSTGKQTSLTFKTPSITAYIDSAYSWIGGIANLVEKSLSVNATPDEKEALIKSHGTATSLRQYTHWIESIEIDTNIIDDLETIQSVLNILSSDNKLVDNFFEKVTDYINGSTISVIGIPAFNCPKCNGEQETAEYPQFTNVVPIDVIQVFFDLLTQRLERVQTR